MYNRLALERQERIKKLRNKEYAKKRIETGYFLQQVLSKELNVSMEKICYRYGENGKPEIDWKAMEEGHFKTGEPEKNVYFNMSHSGNYVVIAVADVEVGIDIEHKAKNHVSVANRFFCKQEYERILDAEGEEEQKKCFLEIWTKKEAYVKLTGMGMQVPFNAFNVFHDLQYNGKNICFQRVDIKTNITDCDYTVCVCSTDTEYEVISM